MSDTLNQKLAPWTDEEVRELNDYQKCGRWHEYTCGGEPSHALTATNSGWVCLGCRALGKEYSQNNAMEWVTSGEWRKQYAEWLQFLEGRT